jgi:hypothetical protein
MLADMDCQATAPVKDLSKARIFYEQAPELTPVSGDAQAGLQSYQAGRSTLVVYESPFAGTNQGTAVTW